MNLRMMSSAAARGAVFAGGAAAAETLGWSYARQSQSAIGNGRGTGPGQFIETDFMALDKQGNV